jgi:glycosyltransferase involved in cell wall biosynthesis
VAVGERVRDELVEAGIGQRDRFTAIAPGVEEPQAIDREIARQLLGLPVEVPVVLFVGRLTAVKRPDRLVEAFGMVLERVPEAVLAVAGEGELLEEVRRSVERLGDSVRLLGWQSDVARLYAAADLVVISSDNEGMPVTLMEAAMAGVPGVTTDVGSASEVVVHGSTGLVVAPDARDLADAIIVLLVDDDRRSDMGRAAAEQALVRFGAARLVADHVALYRRIIAC